MKARSMSADPGGANRMARALSATKAAANCQRKPYTKIKVPTFTVKGELIAYASPDSTYAVTRRLFDGAKKSIRIGIYDFTAGYIKELLIKAMQRGVKVELMLDLAGADEKRIFDDLVGLGCNGVLAPSCNNKRAQYFPVVHQKVIVIDDEWTLVQSGNYSSNSIPRNERDGGDTPFVPGNRDSGIAIQSTTVAAFFARRLRLDRKLVLTARSIPAVAALAQRADGGAVFAAAPKLRPKRTFSSKSFTIVSGVDLQPVLTPDNYLPIVRPWLESAKKSVLIEQQYIRTWQPQVKTLIAAMAKPLAAKPGLDVRIILGKAFDAGDAKDFDRALEDFEDRLGLKRGRHVRFINQDRYVHCHNKLIIVDGKSVLVSSQNWSDTAVDTNREAGVVIHQPRIARYYTDIFETDWETGVTTAMKKKLKLLSPAAFATGKVVRIDLGDIVSV